MQALPTSFERGIRCRQHYGRAYYTLQRPGHANTARQRGPLRVTAQKQGNDSTSKQSIPPLHRYLAMLTLTNLVIRLRCSFTGCQCSLTRHENGTYASKTPAVQASDIYKRA